MVDLELYRIFTIVANEKNITKASEKLNISQPAVTKHIKNLENALELRLFNRTNHGIELTSDGQKIYEEAKEAVETLNSIFIKYGKNRNINLGVHVSMYKMFSKILTKFSNINENITINISDTDLINMLAPDLSDMISKLENEKLDIIISKKTDNYNHNKIEFINIGEIQDILVVNNNSKLLGKKIRIEDIIDMQICLPRKGSVTTNNFINALQIEEDKLVNAKHITYNAMLDIIEENNEVVGLISKQYIEKELNNKEISELTTEFKIPPIEYGVYINKKNKFKELNQLVKFIRENK
ncbi:carbonate dehydratase [Clostridium sp. CAG:567]|jgi:DNA-binding transcriptional LysR family regulator|nr:carbonate dehydratase [Clostridium sp. CAG:567]